MTPQEIINEIYKLPPPEQKELFDSLTKKSDDLTESEDFQIQKTLFEAGLLREIKPPRQRRIGDFPAIKIEGEPLSETIIRERR